MVTSEDNEGFVIIDKCNSDSSGEVEPFDERGQEEFTHDPSPDHVVKVEVGCGYDAVCRWLIKCFDFWNIHV